MNRKKILIVEDDPKSRFALKSILQDHGHDVFDYQTAEDAAKLDGHPVQTAIIDVRLPQQSGAEFARQFKQSHPDVKIIFVTAYDDLKNHLPLAGCTLLVKPIDITALLKLL